MTIESAFLLAFLALCLNTAWTKSDKPPAPYSRTSLYGVEPSYRVRILDLSFVEVQYAIQYRTDDGELIKVWQPSRNIRLINGMNGTLTYSTTPRGISTSVWSHL